MGLFSLMPGADMPCPVTRFMGPVPKESPTKTSVLAAMLTTANELKSAFFGVIVFGATKFAFAPRLVAVRVCPLASSKILSPEFTERKRV